MQLLNWLLALKSDAAAEPQLSFVIGVSYRLWREVLLIKTLLPLWLGPGVRGVLHMPQLGLPELLSLEAFMGHLDRIFLLNLVPEVCSGSGMLSPFRLIVGLKFLGTVFLLPPLVALPTSDQSLKLMGVRVPLSSRVYIVLLNSRSVIAPYSGNVCTWTAGMMNLANSMVIRMNVTLCTCRTSSRVPKKKKVWRCVEPGNGWLWEFWFFGSYGEKETGREMKGVIEGLALIHCVWEAIRGR